MAVDLRTTLQEESSCQGQGLWLFRGLSLLSLGTGLIVYSPLSPLSSQEGDFVRPSSREEAQQLWEAERVKMRQILDKQQKQMVEDYQWLRQEEKSLVSSRWAWVGRGTIPCSTAGHTVMQVLAWERGPRHHVSLCPLSPPH